MNKTTLQKILASPIAYAKKSKIEDLVKALEYFLNEYNQDSSPLEDQDYDEMLRILEERDPENPFLEKATVAVDDEQLLYPMPSLSKITYGRKEFDKWYRQYKKIQSFQISDKLDGISSQLVKYNGEIRLFSKGTSSEAKNLSHRIEMIDFGDSIKWNKLPEGFTIRGELIIHKEDWKGKIKEQYDIATGAVNGIIFSKTPDHRYDQVIQFVAYTRYDQLYKNTKEMMKDLARLGFRTVWNIEKQDLSEEILSDLLMERKLESNYEIDGLVIDCNIPTQPPTTANPKSSIAFKRPMEFKETTVLDVIWNPTKWNYLAPTLVLEPVLLYGTNVAATSGKNAKYILDQQIGIGTQLIMTKGGETIPDIFKVLTHKKPAFPPEGTYEWNETGVNIISKKNVNQSLQIANFFKCIGVKFMSEKSVEKIYEEGYQSVIDILSVDRSEFYKIKGLGKKSIDRMFDNVDVALKKASLSSLMKGSCCFGLGLGERKIQLVLDVYPDIMTYDFKTRKNLDQLFFESLKTIPGLEKKTIDQFLDGLIPFRDFLNALYDTGKEIPEYRTKSSKGRNSKSPKGKSPTKSAGPLAGKKIAFTLFRDAGMVEKIEELGGTVVDKLPKGTDMVVYRAGARASTSNTIKKAEEKGIPVYEEKEFNEKFLQ